MTKTSYRQIEELSKPSSVSRFFSRPRQTFPKASSIRDELATVSRAHTSSRASPERLESGFATRRFTTERHFTFERHTVLREARDYTRARESKSADHSETETESSGRSYAERGGERFSPGLRRSEPQDVGERFHIEKPEEAPCQVGMRADREMRGERGCEP